MLILASRMTNRLSKLKQDDLVAGCARVLPDAYRRAADVILGQVSFFGQKEMLLGASLKIGSILGSRRMLKGAQLAVYGLGRNNPRYCGSGKKFKRCCG